MIAENKKTIDILVPLAAAGLVGYNLWKKDSKDFQKIAIAAGVVFAVAYIVTTQLTKLAVISENRPKAVPVPADTPTTGSVDANGNIVFDPKPFTNRLKADIYSWGMRDGSIYEDLAQLSNAELVMVYNDWTDRYYSLDGESMIGAMNGEVYGNGWFGSNVPQNVENIISRLQAMGCN